MARRFWIKMLPSFCNYTHSPNPQNEGSSTIAIQAKRGRNAGLDGLRGLGALSVTIFHMYYAYDAAMLVGDGVSFELAKDCGIRIDQHHYDRRSHLVQLPFIRLLYNGPAAVAVFFVISGFVLTVRPLHLARQLQDDNLIFSTLSSATFRRPFRLILPLMVVTFVRMIFTYLKLMDRGPSDEDFVVAAWEPPVFVAKDLPEQFVDWLKTIWRTLNVWDWRAYDNPYDIHLWTINAEFRASLAIFLVTLALCKLRNHFRLLAICLLNLYTFLWYHWDMTLFLSGMLFAHISTTSGSDVASIDSREACCRERRRYPQSHTIFMQVLYYLLLLIATYFISTPLLCSAHTPGYAALAAVMPKSLGPSLIKDGFQMHHMIGACILVGLLVLWKPRTMLNALLESRPAQYLGRLSYSLYLIHGPLLHLFGYHLLSLIWALTGRDTFMKSAIGWFIGFVLALSLSIWVADLVTRGIDEPFVRVTKQLQKQVIYQEQPF